MTADRANAPSCPVPGCPIRYASGADRLCADHVREGELPAAHGQCSAAVAELYTSTADPPE